MAAPNKVTTPPSSQADMKSVRVGRAAAIDPGVRRIPPPMVAPMMIASPNALPRTRSRDGWLEGVGVFERGLSGTEIAHADNRCNGSGPVDEHPLHQIRLDPLHLGSQVGAQRCGLPAQR